MSWSEAGRSGLEAKTGAGILAEEGLSHSGSGMEVAFSLAAQELYSGPGLMTWCGTVQGQQIWRRNSVAAGSQSQQEAQTLKAGCGNHQGSRSWCLDHMAAVSQDASESSEGRMASFLVNQQCHFEDQCNASSSETCTP